jgi:hypothetical protein
MGGLFHRDQTDETDNRRISEHQGTSWQNMRIPEHQERCMRNSNKKQDNIKKKELLDLRNYGFGKRHIY